MYLLRGELIKQRFLARPDFMREIIRSRGHQLRTVPALTEIAAAPQIIMAAARKRIHVMQRPHDARVLRKGPEEGGIIHKVRDPMQVENVIGREFRQDVGAIFRAIGPEGFNCMAVGRDGRTELAFNVFTPDAALGSFAEGGGRFESDHGPVRGPCFADNHGRIDAYPPQAVMEPIGRAGCAAGDVVGAEMHDFVGTKRSTAANRDIVLFLAVEFKGSGASGHDRVLYSSSTMLLRKMSWDESRSCLLASPRSTRHIPRNDAMHAPVDPPLQTNDCTSSRTVCVQSYLINTHLPRQLGG